MFKKSEQYRQQGIVIVSFSPTDSFTSIKQLKTSNTIVYELKIKVKNL